jgi:hypothetical protein
MPGIVKRLLTACLVLSNDHQLDDLKALLKGAQFCY